jgi:hypothetical protein
MSKVYFKPHSAGWITPDGEFKPIRGDMMHDDAAENFPGMPKDETMPSQYAVSQLGYLRVSIAYDPSSQGSGAHQRATSSVIGRGRKKSLNYCSTYTLTRCGNHYQIETGRISGS